VAQAREATFFVAHNAVQVLGGAGYLQDHPVEKWMRDAKAAALYALPTEAAQAMAIAAQLGVEADDADVFAFTGPQAALT
jgi:alkylation response protein AidB-like acyl-CoA dehydrogenase